MYIKKKTQQFLSRGCFSLSVFLAASGIAVAIWNPQITSLSEQQQIYSAGRLKDTIVNEHGQTAFYFGCYMVVLSFLIAIVGAVISDPNPASITAPELPPKRPPLSDGAPQRVRQEYAELELEEKQAIYDDLRDQIREILAPHQWLRMCVKAYSVVIIGGSGSGKSSLASSILLIRKLLFPKWETWVLDPHADLNLPKKVWLFGKVLGSKLLGANIEPDVQILNALPTVFAPTSNGKFTSVALDEFSGWSDPESPLSAHTQGILSEIVRGNRKKNNLTVTCLHGDHKGMGGGEKLPTGLFKALMDMSLVIRIQGEPGDFGDIEFTGKAKWKPPETAYAEGNFEEIEIPELLSPQTILKTLRECFVRLNIGIEKPYEASGEKPKAVWEQRVSKAIDPTDPAFIDALSAIANGPAEEFEQTKTERSSIDWDSLGVNYIRAVEFLSYVFNPDKKISPTEDGSYEVRTLQRNWGSTKDMKTEVFKMFLDKLCTLGIGEFTTSTPLRWRPKVTRDEVPSQATQKVGVS